MYKLTTGWPRHIETGSFVNPETNQEFIAWLAEGNTPEPADPVPNQRIAEIKAELAAIDAKSIRPIREGDKDRLTALEAQAEALRAELRNAPAYL